MIKRIYKPEARKRFLQGEQIFVLPCKVRFDNMWIQPYMIYMDEQNPEATFDRIIRYYEAYNCNAELGYYAAYYVKEDK